MQTMHHSLTNRPIRTKEKPLGGKKMLSSSITKTIWTQTQNFVANSPILNQRQQEYYCKQV